MRFNSLLDFFMRVMEIKIKLNKIKTVYSWAFQLLQYLFDGFAKAVMRPMWNWKRRMGATLFQTGLWNLKSCNFCASLSSNRPVMKRPWNIIIHQRSDKQIERVSGQLAVLWRLIRFHHVEWKTNDLFSTGRKWKFKQWSWRKGTSLKRKRELRMK